MRTTVVQDDTDQRPDLVALVGAAVTGALHLLTWSDGANPYFVICACCFWLGFVIYRARQDRTCLRDWGFRLDNLREASLIPLVFCLVGSVALAIYALVAGHFQFPAHAVLLLLLYPIWGTMQQFLVLGIVVGNLAKVGTLAANRPLLIAVGAIVFGSVHLPQMILTGATTALALLYVPLFLRDRNVLPLGLVHGWLGTFFYLWALNIDPWVQTFG